MSAQTSRSQTEPITQNPYFFIVGCPRSGTTLLGRMLGAHSQIAVSPETHWIPKWFEKRRGVTPEGMVTPKLVRHLLKHRRFPRLGLRSEQIEELLDSEESTSYSHFVSGIFDLYGTACGKPIVASKDPGYVRKIETLRSLWPGARFIHLIRDGRDVCLSVNNWVKVDKKHVRYATWREDPVSTAALWWRWHIQMGIEAGRPLGDRFYHEMRYESLVADPARECAAACAFLGIPYDEAMLRFHEGRARSGPGLSAKDQWLPPTPGLRNWRSQMSSADVERFEAASGELLAELGYGRSPESPRTEVLEHVAAIRERFDGDLLARGRSLPEGW